MPVPSELFHIAIRKTGLDQDAPWWQRWWHCYVWKPFLSFSCKHFEIPAPSRLEPDGSFTFLDNIGLATDKEVARDMCEQVSSEAQPGDLCRVTPLPVDTPLDYHNLQWRGQWWPLAPNPDRWVKAGSSYTAVKQCDIDKDTTQVDSLISRVDQIRAKIKTASL